MSAEILELPAHEIVARLKAGDLTAEAVFEATLERIEAVEGGTASLDGDSDNGQGVHAYISLTVERARAQAQEVDRALEAGEDPGILSGVPIAVKDIFCVSGTNSTAGSKILANFVAPYTATPVARLEKAGAITIGKANLDEFTYGSSTESSAFLPTPRNPWSRGARSGRLFRWQCGRSSGRRSGPVAGYRHIRIHPTAGCILRRRWNETYLRSGVSLWPDRLCFLSRLPRPGGAECQGRGTDAAGDGRGRPIRRYRREDPC